MTFDLKHKREKWVIGNWKMNVDLASCEQLITQIASKTNLFSNKIKMGLAIPYPYLSLAKHLLNDLDNRVYIGAQDISAYSKGAYTGEVSSAMVAEMGAQFVLIGHSERRQYHRETDEIILNKLNQALEINLVPVLCIGENLQERQLASTEKVVSQQLQILSALPENKLKKVIIAYEPVWAIGSGLAASPEQAQAVHKFIRGILNSYNQQLSNIAILYGGSVKAENASLLFSQEDIDGGLIGAASLNAASFLGICQAAAVSCC